MSSLRKVLSSRANGARSRGPVTPQGKQRSSQNALYHGLFASTVVLEDESRAAFDILLGQHLDRLEPVDGIEFGLIEEMVAAHWRMRRVWAIETRILDKQIAAQPDPQPFDGSALDPDKAELDRLAGAFRGLAESTCMTQMHRYETRLHLMYQRALQNLFLLRAVSSKKPGTQNEPNPISGHLEETLLLPEPE